MSTIAPPNATTALANWFGSNRTLASTVGGYFDGCTWVGVPFVGGCCELPYIKCRSGMAADVHRHVINLARVVRDSELKPLLVERLDATLFHPDELADAQRRCLALESNSDVGLFGGGNPPSTLDRPDLDWAYDYFICSWMGRGGNAGTDAEFRQGISVRWNANGGDSCTRFRSATDSLNWWHVGLARWNFLVLGCFEFLDLVKDEIGHGIYSDAPWPGPGDKYTHRFTVSQQRQLARRLASFRRARVVVRYGDHPLIRELYPTPHWRWIEQTSKSQAGGDVNEVLIINGPSYTEGSRA